MSYATPHSRSGRADLTQGPVTGHLIRLTLPMTWGIMAIISFQLVDMFYISLLGTKALAAITFTFPVTFTVFSLILGMSIATSSVLSRQIGRGNWARVRRLTKHALILSGLVSIVLSVAGLLLMDPVFRAMGASDDMILMIHSYMVVWFLGCVFINTPVIGNAALRACGDALSPAVIMTVVAIVNAILDPLLIFGLLGFPKMGMQGAAVATVFANACALLAVLYVLAVRKKMLASSRKHLRLLGDSIRRFLFIAIPAGLTTAIPPITNAVIITLLARTGHDAVAGYGVASRIEAFAFVMIMGLAMGMAPILGQNWGAGQYDRVQKTLRSAFGFACLWSLLVAVILCLVARPVASLFSDEPGVIHATALYFWIVAFSYIPGNMMQGWGSAFNALGFPKQSFLMIVTRLLLVNIPLALIGASYFGMIGVFGAIAVTNLVTGVAFHIWNVRFLRKKMA